MLGPYRNLSLLHLTGVCYSSDVDECASSSDNLCSSSNLVTCVNSNGGYGCQCINSSLLQVEWNRCQGNHLLCRPILYKTITSFFLEMYFISRSLSPVSVHDFSGFKENYHISSRKIITLVWCQLVYVGYQFHSHKTWI